MLKELGYMFNLTCSKEMRMLKFSTAMAEKLLIDPNTPIQTYLY